MSLLLALVLLSACNPSGNTPQATPEVLAADQTLSFPIAQDISDLDPEKEESGEGGWGGLSEFSGRASEEVARAVANAGRKVQA